MDLSEARSVLEQRRLRLDARLRSRESVGREARQDEKERAALAIVLAETDPRRWQP